MALVTEDDLLAALGEEARAQQQEMEAGFDDPALAPLDDEEAEALMSAVLPTPEAKPAPEPQVLVPTAPAWIPGVLAAVAVIVVVATFIRSGDLPDYTLSAGEGDKAFRSATAESKGFTRGSRLVWIATPASPTKLTKASLLDRGIDTGVKPQISPEGAVKVDVVLGKDLNLVPGVHRLTLVVEGEAGARDLDREIIVK